MGTGFQAGLLGLLAFLVYFRTLCPSIAWGDSPEIVAAAYVGGVPHPTGYPLYMLLAHAWVKLLPFGNVAWRMNLLSAVAGGAAVAVVFLLMLRITRSRWASAAGALIFAFSRTFWSQAIVAEVYAFHLLLLCSALTCVLLWDARGSRKALFGAALLYGLCFTHHMMSVLVAPALVYLAATSRHRAQFVRELRWTLPLFLAPLVLYAYLPVAAFRDTPMNWGDPRTLSRFLAHMSGAQYRGRMFHRSLPALWEQVVRYAGAPAEGEAEKLNPGYLQQQFHVAFLALALFGAVRMGLRRRRFLVFTALVWCVVVIYALNYDISDSEVYYLPSHLILTVWMAFGLRELGLLLAGRVRTGPGATGARRASLTAFGLAGVLLAGVPLAGNWQANDLHADWSALVYGRAALDVLKPNALVIGDSDSWYFPLMYTRYVEQRRPDVTLASFFDMVLPERVRQTERLAREGVTLRVPEGYREAHHAVFNNRLLRQVLADEVGKRPVYLLGEPVRMLTEPWMEEAVAPYYRTAASNIRVLELASAAPAPESANGASAAPAAVFGRMRADGSVNPDLEFHGYEARPEERGELRWLHMRYHWRVNNPSVLRNAEVRVLFADADGNYHRNEDGSIDFNNFHPLGQVTGPQGRLLPRELTEVFDVYVPPSAWNKTLYLWVAVVVDGQFLPSVGGSGHYARIGELPVTQPPRFASGGASSP